MCKTQHLNACEGLDKKEAGCVDTNRVQVPHVSIYHTTRTTGQKISDSQETSETFIFHELNVYEAVCVIQALLV